MADEPGSRGDRRQATSSAASSSSAAAAAAAAAAVAAMPGGGGGSAATPDDILRLLETCQLSEQDTDELLKDAYALNRLLRAHLAHVEAAEHQRQPAAAASGSRRSGGGSGRGFGRQLSGPGRHEQSASRRSVSMSGRVQVEQQQQQQQHRRHRHDDDGGQQRLPPIRARSPGQRLADMARVYSSGVIQPGHRAGAASAASTDATAATSSKKRL